MLTYPCWTGTWTLVLELSPFRNGMNITHLHRTLKRSHSIVIINILANINIAKIAWRSIGTWAWSLESLGPSGSGTDTEGWCLCCMEFSCNLLSFRNFSKLLMLTWSGILIRCHSGSEKPIMWR